MKFDIALRNIAEGFAIEAHARYEKYGVRVVNHAFDHNGQRREWLTIFAKNGQMRVWQHYPSFKMIGQIPTETLKKLTTPPPKGFSSRAIRGHFRDQTRRAR